MSSAGRTVEIMHDKEGIGGCSNGDSPDLNSQLLPAFSSFFIFIFL